MEDSNITGVLILDKEKDFTSFDAVAVVRKAAHTKRVGHTGTLDPMATGVLPILLGRATRAEAILPDTDKEYLADFRLGVTTDTQDAMGKILTQSNLPVSRRQLEAACEQFRGNILQVPPMYSALKHNGVKLYDLARKGIEVEREARPVTIFQLEIISYDEERREGSLSVSCSKGTYIRTLCEDIGNVLGCGGIMTELRRTQASGFTVADSIKVDTLRALAAEGRLAEKIHPIEEIFRCYPAVTVTEKQAIRFKNGGGLDLTRVSVGKQWTDGSAFRVFAPDGLFLGVGKLNEEQKQLEVLRLFF